MSDQKTEQKPASSANEPMHFRFIEFNPRRAVRGAEAARVEVSTDGEWLWMSKKDIKNNMRDFGKHAELQKALLAYGSWA